jgi:hypothetical protein
MDISVYLKRTLAIPQGGIVSENCCRPACEGVLQSIDKNLTVINELKQSVVGRPFSVVFSNILIWDGR